MLGHGLLLNLKLLRGQGFGVAIFGLTGLTEIDLHKAAPQRFDLLGHHGTRIEGFDAGTQALGRGNRLQTGHAGPYNEDLGRGNGSGGGHHHGEDTVHPLGRQDNGHVAAQVGLRTEGIHLLGQGRARDHLHADRRDAGGLQLLHQPGLVERIQVADMNGALLHQGDILALRLAEAQHHVGRPEEGSAIGHDRGAGLCVGGISMSNARPDSSFDLELRTHLHHLGGIRRHEGDTLFIRVQFA